MTNDTNLSERFTHQSPGLYEHQKESVQRYEQSPYILNFSDAGTGKTAAWLDWFAKDRESRSGGKGIVFAPLSILEAAWANDAAEFTPGLRVQVVTAADRHRLFRREADLYITNHDMMRAIAKDPKLLPEDIDYLNIDESTAYKNQRAARSKAAYKLTRNIDHRTLMTATPRPSGIWDLWHQALLCDDGERLGQNYYRFLNSTCEPHQVGPHQHAVRWSEKEGASDAVADILSDIVIRYRLEECIEMPPRIYTKVPVSLSKKHRKAYEDLLAQMILYHESGAKIDAIHAGALRQKLLQLLSGAVYDEEQLVQTFATERYELVADFVEQRPASLVAYEWRHQRDAIAAELKKRNLRYAIIDSSVPKLKDRTEIVRQFQAGDLRAIIAHPKSAGHGLTLTRGVSIIWPSPTSNSELFTQLNARIYRAGQDKRTEIIQLHATNTREDKVYDNLDARLDEENDFLTLVT